MAKISHEQLITVLEAAATEPIGIVLATNDVTAARAALYRARAREANPRYEDLQFRQWPYEDGDLVVCHSSEAPAAAPNNLGPVDLGGILDLDLDVLISR